LIFEYRLKISNNLLIESVSPNKKNFDYKIIVDWISKKVEFGSITLKEQYNQKTLDDRGYFYTTQGKLVQGKKNAPGGIEAKYVYPDLSNGESNDPLSVPKDPKKLPQEISPSTVNDSLRVGQATSNISRTNFIEKNVAPLCKTTKDNNGNLASYLGYNIPANALGKGSKPENNLKYLCHTNYCNTYRDQKYDPEKRLCKNNTALSKIKEAGWEGFFEFLRDKMNSIVGAAVQVVLDIFGAGVGVQFAWFVLLCWDVSRPEKNWLNIFVDAIGILTFGTGPSVFMSTIKSFGVSVVKLSELELINLIASHKKELEWVLKYLPTMENIFKLIVSLGETVVRIFGGPGAEFLINSINAYKTQFLEFIAKITSETAAKAVEKGVEKLVKKAGEAYVGKPVAQSASGEYFGDYKGADKVASKTSSVVSKIK
jgi:hypothetical protein